MAVFQSNAVFSAERWNSVANLTALRALTPGRYQTATTSGYATAGDGGGTSYYWDAAATGADDGGGTITPSTNPASGRWKLLQADVIDARWFGATFTNSATFSVDNTPKLQAALDFIKAQGGGTLEIKSPLRFLDIVSEVYVPSFTTIRSTPRNFLRRFGVPAADTGFLAIRDPAGVAAVRDVLIDDLQMQQVELAAEAATHTATAGQTVFTIVTTGALGPTWFTVKRGTTLLSPVDGSYSINASGIVLTTPATAGEVIRIARTRPTARNTAIYSEGANVGVRNSNISIQNIRVVATPALYVGIELLWTSDSHVDRWVVQGVSNRGAYNYGLTADIKWTRGRVTGLASSGVFNGTLVTQYGVDNNAFDASNTQSRVSWSGIDVSDCYRGASWAGAQNSCSAQAFSVSNITTAGGLLQDTATGQANTMRLTDWSIANVTDGVTVHSSQVQLDGITVNGCVQGIHFNKGTNGTAESRSQLSSCHVMNATADAYLFRDQSFMQASGLYASVCANGLRTIDTQLSQFTGLQMDNITGIAIRMSPTCYRNDIPSPSLTVGGTGVQLEAGGALHTIRDSRIYAFTTAVTDSSTGSIIRYTDAAGVSQPGAFAA